MNIEEILKYLKRSTVKTSRELMKIFSMDFVFCSGFSRWHNNVPFSTYDHFATDQINCPEIHGAAGWWYHFGKECAHVQLNGQLPTHSDGLVPHNHGILWISWKNDRHHSFQRVEMAIQRKTSN